LLRLKSKIEEGKNKEDSDMASEDVRASQALYASQQQAAWDANIKKITDENAANWQAYKENVKPACGDGGVPCKPISYPAARDQTLTTQYTPPVYDSKTTNMINSPCPRNGLFVACNGDRTRVLASVEANKGKDKTDFDSNRLQLLAIAASNNARDVKDREEQRKNNGVAVVTAVVAANSASNPKEVGTKLAKAINNNNGKKQPAKLKAKDKAKKSFAKGIAKIKKQNRRR
jgi:hypothetical protein